MALTRRSGTRFAANIWPGFVDAMTALLLVLMFVLSIFMIVQSILRETVSTQETELNELAGQVAGLAQALGLEQQNTDRLESQVGLLDSQLQEATELERQQAALIASLTDERDAAQQENEAKAAQISSFEAQVAALLAENTDLGTSLQQRETELVETEEQLQSARASISELEEANSREISEREALALALAQARDEIDVSTEEARLAAARREALEALIADLQTESETQMLVLDTTQANLEKAEQNLKSAEQAQLVQIAATEELRARLKDAEAKLSEEDAQKLADAAAAEALRERLKNADTELTAMTLQLEEQRRRAEETLILLAAERAAKEELESLSTVNPGEREQEKLALSEARTLLSEEQAKSAEAQLQVELLNQQTAALRTQLNSLQALLDEANAQDAEAQVQIDALGRNLNTALARVAAEQKKLADEQRKLAEEKAKIAELEAAEVERLAAEALDLRSYRSEFFGRVREILGSREGVQIQGDRFVFSSEVLFPVGSATLGDGGRQQISRVASVLREVSREIPPEINWILRVDGHTDKSRIAGFGPFANNWELSQARALSVVEYLVDFEGIPPNRLAAAGFGEYQPLDTGNSPQAFARNRRIELKFTEK